MVNQQTSQVWDQLEDEEDKQNGRFSPKRFKRFPRFTIFLNRDENKEHFKDNIISLNPEFMNFLLNPNTAQSLSQI